MSRVSVHALIEAMDCLPLRSFPSIISVSAETLTLSSSTVLPNLLPPEVANRMIFLPEKSYFSRKVLMIVGATYLMPIK